MQSSARTIGSVIVQWGRVRLGWTVGVLAVACMALAGPPGGKGGGNGGGGGDPPANPEILYLDRSDIYVMDADGANPTRLLRTGRGAAACASWSPDASQVVFAAELDGVRGVYVMNADGSQIQLVSPTANVSSFTRPVWSPLESPDGRYKIAFSDKTGSGLPDLFVVNPDGSGLVNLTQTANLVEWCPTWSPDGSCVAVVRDYGELVIYELALVNGSIAVVNETVVLSTEVGFGLENMLLDPCWANTGEVLALSIITPALDADLFLFDIATQVLAPLTNTPDADERSASFSPDDSRIAFARLYSDEGIHVMDTGTGSTSLISTHGTNPEWKQ